MKRTLSFFVIIIFAVLSAHSQDIDSLLKVLDECIEKKDEYRAVRHHTIDSLKNVVKKGKADYDVYYNLYLNYSHLQADSALYYLDCMGKLDEVKNDASKSTLIELDKAEQLAIIGAYDKARNIVEDMHADGMSREVKTRYYHVCRTIYGWTADYLSDISEINDEMLQKTHLYRDSIMVTEQDELSREIVHADYLIAEGKPEEARKILLNYLTSAKNENLAYCYYTLAQAYKNLNDTDNEMRYLIQTAIADMHRGVTEYAALPELVQLLMQKGDIKHAYEYMLCSMEDAFDCHAQLRSLEIGEIYPLLEKEHNQREAESKHKTTMFLIGLVVLALLLIIVMLYLIKETRALTKTQKKLADTNLKLEDTNKQLADTNQQLADTNLQLEEANALLGKDNKDLQESNTNLHIMDKLKEEYIAMFISKCRKYITSLEMYRKSLLKLAKNNQSKELLKTLKDDSLVEKEEANFYKDFDEAFLEIHPNFVERFNALLSPEDRIVLKKDELLNAELRIFALIRLGITDTAQIAEFLNYSMPTIYNYRSRIRNKSIYGKDEFEKKVMEL